MYLCPVTEAFSSFQSFFFFFFRLISILSEAGQAEKDKYMILFICGNLKKNDANKLIYKTATDSQTQRMNLRLSGES